VSGAFIAVTVIFLAIGCAAPSALALAEEAGKTIRGQTNVMVELSFTAAADYAPLALPSPQGGEGGVRGTWSWMSCSRPLAGGQHSARFLGRGSLMEGSLRLAFRGPAPLAQRLFQGRRPGIARPFRRGEH